MNFQEIVDAVSRGELDGHFDEMTSLMRARKDLLSKQAAIRVQPGQEIRITDIRPKRFSGYTGTVVRKEGDRVIVALALQKYDEYDRMVQRYLRPGTKNEIALPVGTFELV